MIPITIQTRSCSNRSLMEPHHPQWANPLSNNSQSINNSQWCSNSSPWCTNSLCIKSSQWWCSSSLWWCSSNTIPNSSQWCLMVVCLRQQISLYNKSNNTCHTKLSTFTVRLAMVQASTNININLASTVYVRNVEVLGGIPTKINPAKNSRNTE